MCYPLRQSRLGSLGVQRLEPQPRYLTQPRFDGGSGEIQTKVQAGVRCLSVLDLDGLIVERCIETDAANLNMTTEFFYGVLVPFRHLIALSVQELIVTGQNREAVVLDANAEIRDLIQLFPSYIPWDCCRWPSCITSSTRARDSCLRRRKTVLVRTANNHSIQHFLVAGDWIV